MRRWLVLTVLLGLLSIGCGSGKGVVEPTNVPPQPSGPPGGVTPEGAPTKQPANNRPLTP